MIIVMNNHFLNDIALLGNFWVNAEILNVITKNNVKDNIRRIMEK